MGVGRMTKKGAKKKKYEKEQIRLSFFEKKDKSVDEKITVDVTVIKVDVNVPVINVDENVSKIEDVKIVNGVKCDWCGKVVEKKNTRHWHTGALICIPCWDEADQKYKKMMEELVREMGIGKLGNIAG